ncbi:hypothetical protein DY000_02053396 [Brassica cretica]|uniref:t-SNARE coiled-coil homology domain-containing protein n=1 Tax=Brassica cretica TaxID=69181 RepID=A0ABQ7AI57_BRACR|nr:hypothetical protein DY000_02053396 [Brassica cretica]
MCASPQKKTDQHGKLVASLAKQVETLTAKARRKAPRGTTRARSGRRLDFENPGNRAAHADKASSCQNPDETLQPGAQPTAENLPPPTGSNEGEEIERIDMDISDQSDHSDDGADIHPRRTRSQSARQEEENHCWVEQEELAENQARIHRGHRQARKAARNPDEIHDLREYIAKTAAEVNLAFLQLTKLDGVNFGSHSLALEGGWGYGSISLATTHAQSDMTTNTDEDPQTHDGTPIDANADKTPAGNVSTVTADTAILDQMKEMFASAQKKTDEQGKLVASLAKQVETLTAMARSKAPRGTTRARSGRRLDFETPSNRTAHTDKASSGQNPDVTLQPGAQPTAENVPPPTGSNEGEEFERIDLDISNQSDHSDDGADIHPRRTRSQSARQDASFEKPMNEEEDNLYWSDMTTTADKDPQTHDGTPFDANADKTPARNVSTVTADTAILDQMKEMFASAQKKTDEQGKLVASSGQNPNETLQPGAQPTAENLPPPTGSNEGEEIERIDLDISDQSDHSNDGADIHPRRT